MSMISELLDDLSSLQTEMQSLTIFGDNRIRVIERAKECIKMQSAKLQSQLFQDQMKGE